MAEPTSSPDVQDLCLWKARWELAAPVLEKLRNDELRCMTPQQRLQALDGLLRFGYQFRRPKSVAKWAEFQRKARERFR